MTLVSQAKSCTMGKKSIMPRVVVKSIFTKA